MGVRSDLLAVENALKAGWDVPPETIESAKRLANDVLSDPASTEREKQRAQSTLETIGKRSKADVSGVCSELARLPKPN